MHFSSPEFFHYLKQEITNPSGSEEMYRELIRVIKQDVSWKLYMKIEHEEDRDDVFQEICLAVYVRLTDFLLDPRSEKGEEERYCWLFTIVDRKICDYYRKNFIEIDYNPTEEEIINRLEFVKQKGLDQGKRPEEIQVLMEKERERCYKTLRNKIPLVPDPDGRLAATDNENIPEKQVILDDIDSRIATHLEKILNIKTAPEKRMAYIYSKIIIPIEWGGHISGKPRAAEKRLKDHTLFDVLEMMKDDLTVAFNRTFPDNIFSKLESDLNVPEEGNNSKKCVGHRFFGLSCNQITSGTNRIQDKVDEFYDDDPNKTK